MKKVTANGSSIVFILPFILVMFGLNSCVNQKLVDDELTGYLFAYFIGNGPGEESIHFAVSSDGFHYRALNDNQPVLDSKQISTTGGVRDPHILRGADGNTFYMVATDL